MSRLMTIDEYMDRTFSKASQPHINTVRRWIREGKLKRDQDGPILLH